MSKVTPKIKMRGAQTIIHHLFKCSVGLFKKDMSWKKGVVNLQNIEHVHYYHSVNSMGMKQKYTTTVGDHFHEVEWNVDPKTGELVAKCGPALRKRQRNTGQGVKTTIEPLRWLDMSNAVEDEKGELRGQWVVDNHRHDIEYLVTDELTPPGQQNAMPKQFQEAIAGPKVPEGFTMTDATTPRGSDKVAE